MPNIKTELINSHLAPHATPRDEPTILIDENGAMWLPNSIGGHSPAYQGPLSPTAPASSYKLALRAYQSSKGYMRDQSPVGATQVPNTAWLPVAFAPSVALTLGQYITPSLPNGKIYKVTTAGTTGTAPPTFNTTIGGTTAAGSGGTAVFTTEKGGFDVDSSGTPIFRSLSSAQIVGDGSIRFSAGSLPWDLRTDSLIVAGRIKFDWNASGQAAAKPIISNRIADGAGFSLLATGGDFNDIRLIVKDTLGNYFLSDNMAQSNPNTAPMNGSERAFVLAIDGVLKKSMFNLDRYWLKNSDMFTGTNCPNGASLGNITGSTVGGALTLGGDPGSATSYECAFTALDILHLPGRALPLDMTKVANSYNDRGYLLLPEGAMT